METLKELEPVKDTRKSFYKKAYVASRNGRIELYSYGVLVVTIGYREIIFYPEWEHSTTTMRHVKEFIYQQFGETLSSSDIRARIKDGKYKLCD